MVLIISLTVIHFKKIFWPLYIICRKILMNTKYFFPVVIKVYIQVGLSDQRINQPLIYNNSLKWQLPSDNIHTILFVSYPIQIILMTTTRPCQKVVRHAFSTIPSCLVNDQDGTIVYCNVEIGLDSGPRSSTLQEKKIFIITIPNCIFWDGWTSGVKSC